VSRCTTCDGPRSNVALGGAARTLLGVTASVEPRLALRCAAGHADPADLSALTRAIDGQLVLAWGRPFRPARCGACRGVLDLPLRTTLRSMTVEPPDTAPFTVDLELPVTRCGSCAVDNVAPGLGRALRRTAAAALSAPPTAGSVEEPRSS
jgi:hypothetical protein